MGSLDKLETTLDNVLDKNAPLKLPENARKTIAGAMWWLALVVGILELWAAYQFWHWGHYVNQGVDIANSFARYYGVDVHVARLGFMYYVTVVVLGLVGVLFLVASPHLKNMKKEGWNLLFYGALLEAVVAVVRLFVPSAYGGGFGNFLMSAIAAVVGAYFLFQIRGQFMMHHMADHKAGAKK